MEVKAATATNNIQTSTWSYKPFIAMYVIENDYTYNCETMV